MHIRGLAPQLKKSPHCQNVKRVLALLDESFLFVQWNAAASGKQSDQQRRENRNHDGSHTLERSLVHLEKPFGFRRSRFNRLADITLTKTTKERIGIESGIVTIAPRDLEGISADRFNVHQHNKERHIVGLDSKLTRPLIGAGRTGTMLAQIPDGINGLVPVTPFDAQHPFVQPLHVFGFEGSGAHVVSKT
jgi:hypothetical protein